MNLSHICALKRCLFDSDLDVIRIGGFMFTSCDFVFKSGRDIKARQTTRNRIPSGRSHYPRLSTSDHKIYEARRRSSASRDYDYRRRDDARKRDEEERRPRSPERERKKDKEGPETQTREIQRILTMVEDPKEQIDQFLALINKKSENKNRRKVNLFLQLFDCRTC